MPRLEWLARGVRMLGALAILAAAGGWTSGTARASVGAPGTVEEFPMIVGVFSGVFAMTPGSEGSLWFTALNLEDKGVIDRMALDGSLTGEFTVPNAPGEAVPTSLAVGPDGNIWFAGENAEYDPLIGRVTPAGNITEFPVIGDSSANEFGQIVAGPDGDMWFIDKGAIRRINTSGVVSEVLAEPGEPTYVVTGSDSSVWFTGSSYIGRLAPDGTLSEFPTPGPAASVIARGHGGSMWFTDYTPADDLRIGMVTPTGQISEYPVPRKPNYTDVMMTEGSDGNLWFTDPGSEALWRLTPTGSFTSFPLLLLTNIEPREIINGADGNLWFSDVASTQYENGFEIHIGRFVTPFAAANLEPPRLSGAAIAGQALAVSEGSWSNGPNAITYQWQVCGSAGDSCTDLDGQVGATYILTSADIGHTLRAAVTASNAGGAVTIASGVSEIVGSPPPRLPQEPGPNPHKGSLLPLIASTMTWRFKVAKHATTVESFVVHGLPAASSVTVACHGRGCPFARKTVALSGRSRSNCRGQRCRRMPRSDELDLHKLFKGRRLGVGTQITVSVTKSGWIGKRFTFTVNSGRLPTTQVVCSNTGSQSAPHAC